MNIFQEGVAQQIIVAGLTHDGRDGGQARLLGSPPAPLPHHYLVAHAGLGSSQ
ncbi:Uncharacterised protein [Mycobacterium tuberculosis]|uniref:Uncharacterized protein n=1 Tax=Mycobacterium tuberculosis TaxID=1773 RepID=A0A655IXG4_MYCTX|nr:Uncharacterised protein [Mycobacterium tuberculosis]COZ38963.1 Uncharacterised protein [Mycobacterium tuberculosis]